MAALGDGVINEDKERFTRNEGELLMTIVADSPTRPFDNEMDESPTLVVNSSPALRLNRSLCPLIANSPNAATTPETKYTRRGCRGSLFHQKAGNHAGVGMHGDAGVMPVEQDLPRRWFTTALLEPCREGIILHRFSMRTVFPPGPIRSRPGRR